MLIMVASIHRNTLEISSAMALRSNSWKDLAKLYYFWRKRANVSMNLLHYSVMCELTGDPLSNNEFEMALEKLEISKKRNFRISTASKLAMLLTLNRDSDND